MSFAKMPLGELAEQIRGVTYAKADAQHTASEETIPLLRATNIDDGEVDYDDLVYVPNRCATPKQYLLPGDLLLAASSGSLSVVGKAGLVRKETRATFGAFCKVIRPTAALDSSYLSHYFRTAEYRSYVSSVAEGANINNLRNSDLDDLEIPLPELAEQHRIAEILDQADTLRAKRRQTLALLDELIASRFAEFFLNNSNNKSRELELSEICELITDGTHSSPLREDQGVPVLSAQNVKGGTFTSVTDRYTTKNELKAFQRRVRPVPGDVLLTIVGTIGRSAVLTEDFDFVLQRSVAILRPRVGIVSPTYLRLAIEGLHFQNQLKRATNTSSQAGVYLTKLKSLRVVLPSKNLQDAFGDEVSQIEKLKSAMQTELAQLDELFASLQDRAFKGEL